MLVEREPEPVSLLGEELVAQELPHFFRSPGHLRDFQVDAVVRRVQRDPVSVGKIQSRNGLCHRRIDISDSKTRFARVHAFP